MPVAPLWGVPLDFPDPLALAAFYQRIGGGRISVNGSAFAELRIGGFSLGFQRIPAWLRPSVAPATVFTRRAYRLVEQ